MVSDIDESREDPVLVRPYVKAVAEAEQAPDEAPETWPEPAERPERESDTLVQPAVVDDPAPARRPRSGLHPLARAGIFVGGAALALGVVGYLVLGPASDPGLPQPGVALPAAPGQAPLDPISSAAASAKASKSASPSVSPSASSPSPSVSSSLSPSPSVKTSAPPSSAPADPTLAPPAADRTGKITAAGGRCLARGGIFGGDGSPVTVSGCMSVSAQTFTLATDGTLRVSDKCAQAQGDGSVRVGGCGDGDAGQWRAGPDGTLVNSAGCLTDPGRAGATATVTACSGAQTQSWSLP
ncbi:RICIN domain-containing protein [Actinoplanes solisilvae]|uniref:RICIN domain-containing protein n=1 Tax=Actinoplanes solisilvae TaxID=2486853 RepID=UPI000FD98C23|nr:RICIN domain-containing protein [Actinoplanes solisilvae]